MEEKKLTDEEIVKAVSYLAETGEGRGWIDGYKCKVIKFADILDLIHRLQSENEQLKKPKFGNWKVKFFKAQAEIERLTEEKNDILFDFKDRVASAEQENAELQKQVDKCFMEVGKMCEESEKDRTREILQILQGYNYDGEIDELIAVIGERYGVEVE